MEVLPIDLNEGVRSFIWEQNCILYRVDETTPSKTIYQGVCDEIGRFYKVKGFMYAPSSRKLEYQYQDYKYKIHFSSSHSNMTGNWVLVEISAGMYPIRLEKQYKEANEKLLPIILSNIGILDAIIPDRSAGTIVVVSPFGDENESFEKNYPFALRKYTRAINAYNISIENFRKTLEYINKLIEYSFSLVLNETEMIKHINKSRESHFKFYEEKRFVDYLHLYYPNDSKLKNAIFHSDNNGLQNQK